MFGYRNILHLCRMKKVIVVVLIFLGSISILYSQNTIDTTKSKIRGIIRVNPIEALLGEFRVEYEKPFMHNISLDFGASFIYLLYYPEIYGWEGEFGTPEYVNGSALRLGIKFTLLNITIMKGFIFNLLFL
jgi:hypothetical protein